MYGGQELADNWNRGISVEVLSGTAWNRKSCNMAWLFYAFFHLRVMGLPRLLEFLISFATILKLLYYYIIIIILYGG